MHRFGLSRRASLKLAGTTLGALLIEANLGRLAYAKSADTLVIGMDISDTNSFDPGHQFVYSAPITMRATYETLVTMAPGQYSTLLPLLARSWELADDGAALVFHLRKDVKFSSGNEMTATDVQFTFDRLRNLKDNPAELASNIASVAVVDPRTVKIVMVDKAQPLLNLLVGPSFVVGEYQGRPGAWRNKRRRCRQDRHREQMARPSFRRHRPLCAEPMGAERADRARPQ